MAEVGLAASVLGLAQTAFSVAKGLYDLAEEVSSAGEAVRVFANDFLFFVQTLKTLGDLFNKLPPVDRRTESATEELLEVAREQVVQPFHDLLVKLEPLLVRWKDCPGRMNQLSIRIRWVFSYKSKVLFYHGALNALKGNLSILLQTMSLQGQNPPHIHFILCTSIADTRAVLQSGMRPQGANRSISRLEGANVHSITSRMEASSMSGTGTSTTPVLHRDERHLEAGLAVVHVTNADESEAIDDVAEGLVRISILHLDESVNATESRQASGNGDQLGQTRQDSAEVPRGSATTYAQHSAQPGPRRRPVPATPTSEQELVTSKTRLAADQEELIYYRDILGSDFEIPFHLVRIWQGMHAFLIAAMDNADYDTTPGPIPGDGQRGLTVCSRLADKISEQHFTIMLSHNPGHFKMVLPSDWDSRVKPGCRVSLVFDDQKLAGTAERCRAPSWKRVRKAQTAAQKACVKAYTRDHGLEY